MYVEWVLVQFEFTLKALANFSPAVGAQRQPWESKYNVCGVGTGSVSIYAEGVG
jgi:hypothetical protein